MNSLNNSFNKERIIKARRNTFIIINISKTHIQTRLTYLKKLTIIETNKYISQNQD